jgi:hypothetical protein
VGFRYSVVASDFFKGGSYDGQGVLHPYKPALVELARSDKKLRGYLEMLAAPGKYGALAMAVLGIVIPILVNHGVIKELSFFSAPSN